MIEILLGIITLIGIATLFLLTQKKTDNSDVKFQTSLDEKIKRMIHDNISESKLISKAKSNYYTLCF